MSFITTLGLIASTASAAPVEVTTESGNLSLFPDLASALSAAGEGDALTLLEGDHGDLVIETGTTLSLTAAEGAAYGSLVINGAGTRVTATDLSFKGVERAVEVRAGALALLYSNIGSSGSAAGGYAIRVASGAEAAIMGCEIADNSGQDGVIIAENGAALAIIDSDITNNHAVTGGALLSNGAEVSLRGVRFGWNGADEQGGAIALLGGSMRLESVTVSSGTAALGAGIYVGPGASLQGTDVELTSNIANEGGHVYVDQGTVAFTSVRMTDGQAGSGAGIAINEGMATLTNAYFQGQVANDSGGAAWLDGGELVVKYATVVGNSAGIGAGFGAETGRMTITGALFDGNDGESVASAAGMVDVDRSIIPGMSAGALEGVVLVTPRVLDAAPGFASALEGDYALRLTSPALDAGLGGDADPDGTPADWGMYGGQDAWEQADLDGDGYVHGRDCDDRRAGVNEHATETYYDGIDANCDQLDDYDQDGDGFRAIGFGGGDCDDVDPETFPGAEEHNGDKSDSDCDGMADIDADGDGWTASVDCNDDDPSIHPGMPEDWYDGTDANCDGRSDFDRDGDGYDSVASGGTDCDDRDPFISPVTVEIQGDGIDQDCDGMDGWTEDSGSEDDVTGRTEPGADWAAGDASAPAPTGCSTISTAHAGIVGALLALVFVARRRED